MSEPAVAAKTENVQAINGQNAAAHPSPVGGLILLLCMAAVVAACIELLHSGRNYQELVTLNFALMRGPVSVTHFIAPDDPVPLYYAGVRYVAQWFRPTLTSLRLLSFCWYILALLVTYMLATMATNDRRVGVLAVVLLGVSPFSVWYASRAAPYALLPLIVLTNMYFFVRVLQGAVWPWAGYAITAFLGVGVHYFFIVVVMMQLLFGVAEFRKLTYLSKWLLPITTLACLAALIAWIRYVSMHSSVWAQLPYTARPVSTNVFIIFVQFLFGFQSVETITFVIALWPLLVILALLAVQKYVKPPLAVRYFAFAAIGPVVAAFVCGLVLPPLFLSSYLIVCLPPFVLLVAWYAVTFELPILALTRNILILTMAIMLLLELANQRRALMEDYLGVVRVFVLVQDVETSAHHPAFSASVVAYSGHQTPAAGPPLHMPSDSPGVLIQR